MEGVFKHFSEATQINGNGETEDWKFRMMIHAMLKLIQNIYERIEEL